ncbi:CotH kinase family protein [Paenibacillus sp. JDR-2]|uniref:CotH kinase family protein n=1 Tax=Paenibacillus sp. (strain JDR-2) TaxID=324057 RepID=UPI0001AAF6E3|nr:CotH kinase family protein [Paenibacillus sp. JDR-2]ACT00697.1 Spore coat protein CotH [Paenibacillus sp. JDR-2]
MKAKFLLTLFSIILIIGLTGCGSKPTANNEGESAENKATTKEEQFLDETVFPKNKVVDVKITIDEDQFQDIIDNASAEEYHTASVDYNGEHFDNVGIRAKGNLSLRSVVQMEDSDRYSFKISFDEYVNQTLGGISKINLNNNYSDASYMREFLTYELAEQMGLPTPKFSFVNVYVNDKLWGFYLAIEQVGDEYLNRNFDNSYGALYKGIMGTGSDLLWIDDKLDSYPGLAQKSKSSNNDILIDMLKELNSGTDLEKYINVDDALGYIALNVATNNMDSYLGSNKQNYYLYEDDGVFSILPWDYNMAFGGMGMMGGGGGSSSLLIDEPTQSAVADRPLIAKLLAVDEYKEKYHEMLQKIVDGYLSDSQFQARVNELNTMIASYVKADPSSFYTYEQYEAGVKSLISTNASMISNISQQLDGTIASSGDGSGSGGGFGGGGGMRGGGNRQQNAADAGGQQQGAAGGNAAQQGANGAANTKQGAVPAAAQGANGAEAQQSQGSTGTGNANGGQQQGAAQGGDGMGFPGGDMGGPPDGFQGGGMGQPPDGFQGGMGGGGFPGMGMGNQTAEKDNSREAITAGIAILVLLLSCLFIKYFNRRRL